MTRKCKRCSKYSNNHHKLHQPLLIQNEYERKSFMISLINFLATSWLLILQFVLRTMNKELTMNGIPWVLGKNSFFQIKSTLDTSLSPLAEEKNKRKNFNWWKICHWKLKLIPALESNQTKIVYNSMLRQISNHHQKGK